MKDDAKTKAQLLEELQKVKKELRVAKKEVKKLTESEYSLLDCRELHKFLLDKVSDAVVITDKIGNIQYVSYGFRNLFELEEKNIQEGGSFTEVLKDFSLPPLLPSVDELYRRELHLQLASGREIFTIMSVQHAPVKMGRIVWIFQDITASRKATQLLKMSRETYRMTLDLTEKILYDYDTVEGTIMWTGAIGKVTGYSIEELQSHTIDTWKNLIHPDDLQKATKELDIAAQLFEPYKVEYRFLHKNGKFLYVSDTGQFIADHTGRPFRMLGMIEDISENKWAEKALRDSEEKYRLIFERSPIGIIHYDNHGTVTDANQRLMDIIGVSRDQIICMNLLDWFQGDQVLDELAKVFAGDPGHYEGFFYSGSKRNELYIKADFSPIFSEEKTIEGGIGIVEDITERKYASDELLKFKTIAENANYGVVIVTMSGHLSYCNDYMANVHNMERTEVEGRHLFLFHSEDQIQHVDALISKLKSKGKIATEEIWHCTTDNERFPMIMNGVVIRDESGEPHFFALTAIDITAMKKAQNALQESENKLRKFVEESKDGIAITNEEGAIIEWNKALEKILQISHDDALGFYIWDIMYQLSLDTEKNTALFAQIKATYMAFLKEGVSPLNDGWLTRSLQLPDESQRYVQLLHFPIRTEKGRLIGSLIRDITQQKIAEEQLRESEERYKSLFQVLPIGIIMTSPGGRIVESNNASERLLGLKVNENIPRGYDEKQWNMIKTDGSALPVEEYASVRAIKENKLVENVETGIRKADGSLIWLSVNAAPIPLKKYGVVIALLDITKRVNIERSLRDSEQRYRLLAENSYDVIFELNENLELLFCSPNIAEVLGYKNELVLHSSFIDLVHTYDRTSLTHALQNESGRIVLRMNHENGELIWFESTWRRFKTSDGKLRGVLVSRDITDRKFLEEQLIHSEKLMAIGEMAAMIAHEFRNALTSVKMILQLQSESRHIPDRSKKSIKTALQSIYHMEDVVQQLLNMSRPTKVELETDNLNAVLNDTINFVGMQAKKNFIEVNKQFDDSIPPIIMHKARIKEIFINLFMNAIQAFENHENPPTKKQIYLISRQVILEETIYDVNYSYTGHSSVLAKNMNENPEIVIEKGERCALIEIGDNGKGMDSAKVSRIFEPFFTTKQKGTGLGLSIVKRSVNAHGGVVMVSSKENIGTTFSLYFPLTKKLTQFTEHI